MTEEAVDADDMAEPGDGFAGGLPKEIHADTEQDGIKYAGDQDPFPQLVLHDKVMGFDVGLEGYDYFLEQKIFLFICSTVKPTYL